MKLFLLVISGLLYWFICGFYGYCIHGISVVIMFVMNMYYDSGSVWFPSFFYFYMNEKCIHGVMDETEAKVIRKKYLIVNLRKV